MPVAVSVLREIRVKKGQEKAFEAAMDRLVQEAVKQEGHMGATVVRPQTEGQPYRFFYRFTCEEKLAAWHGSDLRAKLMEDVQQHIEADEFQVQDGFSVWLDLPVAPPHPVKWKVVFTTWLGIFPTVVVVSYVLHLFNFQAPIPIRGFVLSGFTVPIAAYFVVPHLSRWLKDWIYKH